VSAGIRGWALSMAFIILAGCRLGDPTTPTPLPQGYVAGYVVSGGPVAGANVSIYGPNGLIGSTRTDDNGHFLLAVQVLSAALNIVADGGSYPEAATGATEPSSTLSGIFSYQEGTTLTASVTPLTTASEALANFLVAQGLTPTLAAAKADKEFTVWLGLSVATTQPILVDDVISGQAFNSALRYGLVIAALSQWAHSQGAETTADLTATLVADLQNDGLLNGEGAQGPLLLGSQPLSVMAYRQGLATALAQAAAAQPAGTAAALPGPNSAALTLYAQSLAETTSALFGSAPAPSFASTPLSLSLGALPAWTHGTLTVSGSITDPFGLTADVTLAVDGQMYRTVTAQPTFAFAINTAAFADGQHALAFDAQDPTGASATANVSLGIDNTPPKACLSLFEPLTSEILLAGHWDDISGVVSATLNGSPAQVTSSGTWYGSLPTISGPVVLGLTDAAGNTQVFSWAASTLSNPAPCA